MEPTITQNGALFAFALQTPSGRHLELSVGNVRWALGFYGTNEEALRALKNGRTGFRTSDALEHKTAANEIGTLNRWSEPSKRSEQKFPYCQQ